MMDFEMEMAKEHGADNVYVSPGKLEGTWDVFWKEAKEE